MHHLASLFKIFGEWREKERISLEKKSEERENLGGGGGGRRRGRRSRQQLEEAGGEEDIKKGDKALSLNKGSFVSMGNQVKQLNHQVPDQDLSSSQSTGQSNQELSGSSEGTDGNYQKPEEIQMKTALSLGSSDATFLPPKIDYSHSIACVPFPYVDPYYGGVFAAYGSHAIIHPQIAGFASSGRVPLPLEPAAEEPIYVNAKQYAAILRRRQLRAKLEAQNKVVKARKPYLHESRHLHAMKRARGSGGRFLNTKQLQQNAESSGSKATTATSGSMTVEQCQFGFSPSVGDGRGSMTGNGSEYDYP